VDGCVYLDAYCHTSNGWRTFDVARILNPAVSSEDSEVPPEQFLEMNLRKEIVEVDVVHASELEPFKILTKTENDSKITAEIAVFGDDLLVRRIIASGGRLRVNPELTAKVREKALAGLTAYLDK
jgi:predicted DNA-binding transcriptional regulator YafY